MVISRFTRLLTGRASSSRLTRRSRRQRAANCEPLEVRQLLTGDLDWARGFGGAQGDFAQEVATDTAGNVYTLGTFVGTVDFDPGSAVLNLTSSASGERNTFITKMSATGTLIWARAMEAQVADDLAVDSVGNVYAVGGYFGPDRDLDPGAGVVNVTGPGSLVTHGYVLKLNSAGTFVSAQTYGGNYSRVQSITIDHLDGICIAGEFRGTVDFDPTSTGVANRTTPVNDVDGFVSRQNANGTLQWVSVFVGGGQDFRDIEWTGNSFIAAGSLTGTIDFDPGNGTFNLTSAGLTDAFVLSLSSSGTLFWARSIGGTADDSAQGVSVDQSGSILITGSFGATVDFDPGAGVSNVASAGESDAFVLKLNGAGAFSWGRRIGGTLSDSASAVETDSNGNVFVVGAFTGVVDLDPGAETNNQASAGASDIFVSQLDSAGNCIWSRAMGGSGADSGRGIRLDGSGGVYLVGSFNGVADFDPESSVTTLTSVGDADVFICRLSPDVFHYLGADIVSGTPTAQSLMLRRNDRDLELWQSDVSGGSSLKVRKPLTGLKAIRIFGAPVDSETLTIDFSGGTFAVPDGFLFDAGNSNLNQVLFKGLGTEGFNYRPDAASTGRGSVLAYGQTITFTDCQTAGFSNLLSLAIETPRSADNLILGDGSVFEPNTFPSGVSGQSGGIAIPPASFYNVASVTIDTGLRDAAPALSNDVVTINATGLAADGLKNLFVRTGKGDDTLQINSSDLTLSEPGGSFWYLAGAGLDHLQVTGDANWDLSDSRLVSSGGGRMLIDDVFRASITGGASSNHLNAALFSGPVVLDGSGGNDLLRSGPGNDTIFGGIGNDRIFGGTGDDVLNGQDGHDSLWGEDGYDTVNGQTGNDLIWGGEDDDSLFGHSGNDVLQGGPGRDTLSADIGNDRLFGDAGDDMLLAGPGNDLLFGGDDDDSLVGDVGDDELRGGNGADSMDGGAGNDLLFGEAGADRLGGGDDADLLDGGEGNDRINGDAGFDLYVFQGTPNHEELQLQSISSITAAFRRKPPGLRFDLETDALTVDADDEFLISALDGDDLISIDALFTQLGSVDGGNGTDTCTAPAGWTKVSC